MRVWEPDWRKMAGFSCFPTVAEPNREIQSAKNWRLTGSHHKSTLIISVAFWVTEFQSLLSFAGHTNYLFYITKQSKMGGYLFGGSVHRTRVLLSMISWAI